MAAAFTKTPELSLTKYDTPGEKKEATQLAEAVADVAQHYDIPGLDAVTISWVGLVMTCAQVYGPRYAMIRERMAEEKKEKAQNGNANVVPFFKPRREERATAPEPEQPFEPGTQFIDPYGHDYTTEFTG